MNNSNVAHKWANRIGTRGTGSRFYFDGPALYSYGRHFVVGLHVEAPNGGARCVLMNNGSCSNSTAKHQAHARGAVYGLSGVEVFSVKTPAEGAAAVSENLADYLERIEAAQRSLMHTRKYAESCERELRAVITAAARYAELFPVRGAMYKDGARRARLIKGKAAELAAGTLISETDRARINAKAEAARKADRERAARKAAELAELIKERAEKLEAWTAGVEGVQAPSAYAYGAPELPTRLRIKGAAVETSRGAVVSVRAARVLWHAIKAGRDVVGVQVDGYTVTGLNGTLRIGCHTIERAEVERVGALLDARDAERQAGAVTGTAAHAAIDDALKGGK